MKERLFLIALTLFLTFACSNKCKTFNKDNYPQVLAELLKDKSYTKTEKAIFRTYFIQYATFIEQLKMSKDPSALRKVAKENGFIELDNSCEILKYVRANLKKEGKTEEEIFLEKPEVIIKSAK